MLVKNQEVNCAKLLFVSAFEICKQCLQTASGGGRPQNLYRRLPLDPTGEFRPPNPVLSPKNPKMSLSPQDKTYWSRIRRWIVRNFQNLFVSSFKICEQYLQTDSAGDVPKTHTGVRSWSPLGSSVPQTRWAIAPSQWKCDATGFTAKFNIVVWTLQGWVSIAASG